VITTGAAGGLTDPTQIMIKDLTRTYNDPLAAKVRSYLRAHYAYTRNAKRYFGVECVFSAQQQVYPGKDGSVGHRKPGIHGVHLDCSMGYGSASFVTATMGFVAVARVIEKYLLSCQRRAS
jgi:tRNA A37 threonylcarbamoyladenosine dehydratase